MKMFMSAVLLLSFLVGAGIPTIAASQSLNYKMLEGRWQRSNGTNLSVLVIENVQVVDGEVVMEAFYKSCDFRCPDPKGNKITAKFDIAASRIILQRGETALSLTWHGGKSLNGTSANSTNKPTQVEFNKM